MKQAYTQQDFQAKSKTLISMMNELLESYRKQGFVLTVRQLYYQMVARDIIKNTMQSYKNLASLINDARMCGLLDWDMIEDRTRDITKRSSWSEPADIIDSAASSYHRDLWVGQDSRVVVIVEKEALVGVLQRPAHQWDLHLLAARGYPSVTVLRDLALGVMRQAWRDKQFIHILHFGDHDPSGLDMTRDLRERIEVFNQGKCQWTLKRMALNFDQVEQYEPPPNPAKTTDSRFEGYAREHGEESWELDALEPQVLIDLVEGELREVINDELWQERKAGTERQRAKLKDIAERFRDGEFDSDDSTDGDDTDEDDQG